MLLALRLLKCNTLNVSMHHTHPSSETNQALPNMPRPLFIALDGPKGTGKTTLLEAVTQTLRAANHKVVRLCEKKSDPFRGPTMTLVNQLARNPSQALAYL